MRAETRHMGQHACDFRILVEFQDLYRIPQIPFADFRASAFDMFAKKFKRHIPVIVPLWLIPVACGAVALSQRYSPGLVGLAAAFAVNAFIILPLLSRRHSCSECPQKDDCPWMAPGKPVS